MILHHRYARFDFNDLVVWSTLAGTMRCNYSCLHPVLKEGDLLADAFHIIRTAAVLMHPIAPEGTEMILDYLRLGEEFWSWDRIFEPAYSFMDNPQEHKLKFLEPRVDFFKKHPSQITKQS